MASPVIEYLDVAFRLRRMARFSGAWKIGDRVGCGYDDARVDHLHRCRRIAIVIDAMVLLMKCSGDGREVAGVQPILLQRHLDLERLPDIAHIRRQEDTW